jgi:hypothetical protein
MRNTSKIACLVCAGTLLALLPALAQSKHGHSREFHSPKAAAEAPPAPVSSQATDQHGLRTASKEPWVKVDWQFSSQERSVIQDYVQSYDGQAKGKGKPRSLPPGLAKKAARGESLPPGWQAKCVVGETMPAEVYDHCRPLPPDLTVKLPPAPEPTITVAIGGKVVRLLEATRQILDVFDVHVRL